MLVLVPPSGSWLDRHACNFDLRVGAVSVDVGNDPKSGPCRQATLSKNWKMYFKISLLKLICLYLTFIFAYYHIISVQTEIQQIWKLQEGHYSH